MYNYIPILLWGAGRLVINGMSKRNQAAAAAQPPPSDPQRVHETELYGSNPSHMAIGLVAKLAKSDGVVSQQEVQAVEGIFVDLGAVGKIRQRAIAIFQAAKDGPLAYMDVLDMFAHSTRNDSAMRRDLIFMLLRVAHANSPVPSYQSEHLIQAACTALDLDYQQHLGAFQAWRQSGDSAAQTAAEQLKLAYEILDCQPADSEEHLKHRYRQLVRDFHPDTIAGKGLSPEFTRFAEEKFKQIQAAYEFIVEQRR